MEPKPLPPLEMLWTAKEVARFLACSTKWVYSQSAAGTLPCVRVVGLLRFEPDIIRRWMEMHRK